MRALVLALALGLAACGQNAEKAAPPEQAEQPNPFILQTEIGRYSVMLQQVDDLTQESPDAADIDYTAQTSLARHLRHVVWRYNLERSSLCERGLYTTVACGPAYEPVWLSEPADAAPSLEDLQTRSSAVGEEVMRFWDAVCADARTRAPEDEQSSVCGIE